MDVNDLIVICISSIICSLVALIAISITFYKHMESVDNKLHIVKLKQEVLIGYFEGLKAKLDNINLAISELNVPSVTNSMPNLGDLSDDVELNEIMSAAAAVDAYKKFNRTERKKRMSANG